MIVLMYSIGAAAWFTIFIVKIRETEDEMEDEEEEKEKGIGSLPIWPAEIASATTCVACFEHRDDGPHPYPVMCEKVYPLFPI